MLQHLRRKGTYVRHWLRDVQFLTPSAAASFATQSPAPTLAPSSRSLSSVATRDVRVAAVSAFTLLPRSFGTALKTEEEGGEDAESVPPPPDVAEYTRRMRRYLRDNSFTSVVNLFEEMKSFGIEQDTKSYTAVMKAYSRDGNIDKVVELFDEMVASGIKPDKFVFNTRIYAYSNNGDVDAALKVLSTMGDYDVRPDPVTYRSLMTVCGKGKNLEKAKEFFDLVTKDSSEKDLRNYNGLIDAYSKSVDKETGPLYNTEVSELLERAKGEGLNPDVHTQSHLVKFYARSGMAEEAKKSLGEMKQRLKDEPRLTIGDMIIENLAVMELSQEETMNELVALYKDFTTLKLKPSMMSYEVVLDMFSQKGDIGKAFDFLDALEKEGADGASSISSYRLRTIERMGEEGLISPEESVEKMKPVLEKHKGSDTSLKLGAYRCWLNISCRASDVQQAIDCWTGFMGRAYRPAPSMIQSLLEILLEHNRLDEAMKVFTYLEENKFVMTLPQFRSMFEYLAEHEDKDTATKLYEKLKASAVEPDEALGETLAKLELA